MRGPRRLRLGRRWLIALVLAPPLFWTAVLTIVPTDWARRAIEDRVQRITGCPARLEHVRFGPLGGIYLRDLSILEPGGAPDESTTPWVEAGSVRVDLSLGALLVGRGEPSRVDVCDLSLRLSRDRDGNFPPWLLLQNAEPADLSVVNDEEGGTKAHGPIAFRLSRGRIVFVDAQVATTVAIDDLKCSGTWWPSVVEVEDLRGTLNGGTFALAAEIERGPSPAFMGQLQAQGVQLGSNLGLMTYLVPYLAGASEQLDGKLDLDLELKGQGASGPEIRDSLSGRGMVKIDPIRLEGSSLLIDLARVLPVTQYGKVGSLRSEFSIDDRRILSRKIQLNLGGTPIVLSGGSAFDGRIHYQLDTSPLAGKVGPDMLALLADAGLSPEDLLDLKITGSIDQPQVQLGRVTIDARQDGRSTIEAITRRLRDRLRR
ncbi:AsmA family protein [Tautonia rosea]|uniref:AsmA-like C-terminal region-containing protein n=1 Tax=Tautonia rosea TaxID=2728037 RepID=UPI001475FEDD|nr:AsmA-like C-terminal region-containing protein [Tautonia rosea]